MISDRSEFRVQIRRLIVVMIRTIYRWICNHPFLLGFVGFLYFLHRYCPLLFSPLVTASPVLVCTFVLLGTILSFGEPNIPEIEKEEPETTTLHEAAALFRTEVSRDAGNANATVFERGDKSFTVESFVSKEEDVVVEDGNDDDTDRVGESLLSEVEDDVRPFDYRPLVDETLDEVKRDTQVRFEEKAFILELDKRGERVEDRLIDNDGMLGSVAERSIGGSLDDMVDDSKEDQLDVSPVSPWRPMRHEEDEDDDADRDDSLDSESDGAESSSPDASMTDIIPMLDELHPLLHSDAPGRGIADGEGSDASSEGPHRSSSDEGMESDVDSESQGEEGDNENDEEDEDDEEEEEEEEEEVEKKKEDKDDESKSAIKWTEADQKNVMDLGSLELERNQRLENLIARRRARHNMRLMAERNLIDFDSADIPFNMPPISTARQNPFDAPYDSYDDMGLPPIPGSAPSIMFARRNPFDLPYEPNEEKPDLKGDGFQEEFSSQQPKDAVFRRHESFSVGPSMLGGPRHDRLRPFFVLERLANEGSSYYPFERQLSEVSESKLSSVPDTESVCTVLEDDEKKVDADRETEIAKDDVASDNDEEKSHSASDHDEEKIHSASDHDEEKIHSEKSHSSEDSDFDEQADSRNLHHDVAEIILGRAETHQDQSNIMEGETSDKRKLDEEESSDSDSSLSEKEEKIPDISEDEAMSISERKVDLHEESGASSNPSFGELEVHEVRGMEDDYHHDGPRAEESFITAHPSLDESAFQALCGLVDGHHEEPVYDSSPPSGSRFPSFSSVSSDYKPELPGKNGEEVEENEEREVYSESIGHVEIHSTSGETETSTREVGETSTHVTGEVGIDGQNNSTVSGSEFEDAILDPSSLTFNMNENADHQEDDPLSVSSQVDLEELHEDVREAVDTRTQDVSASLVESVSPTEEEVVSTGMVEQHLPIENTCSPLGSGDTREHVATLEESPDVVHDIAETSVNRSVAEEIVREEEQAGKQKDEASPQTFNADIPIDSYATLSSGAVEYVETHSFNDEDVLQLEQEPVHSSVPDTEEETHPDQTMDIEVDSVNASAQNVGSEETTPSESDRELTWSDKSVVEQSSLEPGEDEVPTRAGSVVFSRNITFHEYHDAPEDTEELSCLTSDASSSPAESPEYTTPMVGEGSRAEFFRDGVYEELDYVVERLDQLPDLHAIPQSPPEVITEEADEIKEIDEGLLSELDTIGDFSIKEVVTYSEPGPSSVGPDTANELTEALPVLEARSVEDIDSAFQQIHEGSEVEDVILPSAVQDQLAQENYGNSTETNSDLVVVEATSKEDLDTAMNQSVVESMGVQIKSPESNGGSGETKCAVETEPSESLVKERSLDDTAVPLNNTPEKEEEKEEESRPKEITTSDVLPVETRSLEEIPKPSEPKAEMSMEVISERVVIPTEAAGPSNVTPSDEVVITTSDVLPVETRSLEEIPKPSEPKAEMSMEVISERVVIPTEAAGPSNVTPSDEVVITTSDVLPVETRSLEEIPKPSEPKAEMSMEVISERVVIPTEAAGPSNVTPSDEVVITTSDVLPVETRSLEEIPKPSEPKAEMSMEVISERVVIPTEAAGPSNVTPSDEVVITTSDVLPVETRSLEEIPKPSEPKAEMSMEVISERVVIPTEAAGPSNVTPSDEVVITTSDVLPVETRSLEEIPKPSEPKAEMPMEVISERVVIPTEAAGPSNVTPSDEVVTEEAKGETESKADANLQGPESKETPAKLEENIAEQKRKEGEEEE
ncbi:PREDICTED: uncharacterized protein LOC104770113 isoform X2 [Camelina sativa]|uniref:Uncharacterized protein LOC104770113 isoform X2 n=1 Tax=Camelina sativa TaxID=90675 RepID=A0ABM0XYD0_CAMSA|nr:PREDICTED: uncharacterized protein LOC104770113 isoform X2 [Camelina sativa]